MLSTAPQAAEPGSADRRIVDATGQHLMVRSQIRKIITLSPAHTDLLRHLQVDQRIVGVLGKPQPGLAASSIGSVTGLDYEKIVSMQPDLILAWEDGTPTAWTERLRALGLAVYTTRTNRLSDIPGTLAAISQLFDEQTRKIADRQVADLRQRIAHLKQSYQVKPSQRRPRVFYQVWHQPVMTVNNKHIISDAIDLCGGTNIFDGHRALVPQIGREAVAARDPELIVSATPGGDAGGNSDKPDLAAARLDHWLPLTQISAVRHQRFTVLDANKMTRPTPAMLDSVARLCRDIAKTN